MALSLVPAVQPYGAQNVPNISCDKPIPQPVIDISDSDCNTKQHKSMNNNILVLICYYFIYLDNLLAIHTSITALLLVLLLIGTAG